MFPLELFGAHVASLQVGVAVVKTHHMNHAVAVEENVFPEQWRIARVGAVSVIRAVEFRRDGAFDFKVVHIAFDTNRRAVAAIDELIRKFQASARVGLRCLCCLSERCGLLDCFCVHGAIYKKSKRVVSWCGLNGHPAHFGERIDARLAAEATVTRGFGATKRHLRFVMDGGAVDMANT